MPSVLVVEDDEVVRGVWAFKLARAGYTVLEAADGEAGLAAAMEKRADVVLLDWMLPNRSGIDVCRAMRDEAGLDGTPVIFLSARDEESDIACAFAAGADDYLVKPVSPRELVSRVEAALARDAVAAGVSVAVPDVTPASFLEVPALAVIESAPRRRRLGALRVSVAVAIGLAAGTALASGGDRAGGPGVPEALRAARTATAVVRADGPVRDSVRRP